jgi:four helix bundle protein
MRFSRFEELEIWQLSIALTRDIYNATRKYSFRRDRGLAEQTQRAAVSVSANIVEGFERSNNNEFIRFLKIAKGSCGEVRNHLTIAREVGYLSGDQFTLLQQQSLDLSRQIAGFIRYLEKVRKNGKHQSK